MQAIVQDNYGSGEALALREIERPEIGEHDVLVRVRAAGVNPADWAVMSGLPYIARPVYGLRRPKVARPRDGCRRVRGGGRQRRDSVQARRRGLRGVYRLVRRVRGGVRG